MNNDKDTSDTTWVQKSQTGVMGHDSAGLLNRKDNVSKPENSRVADVTYWLLLSIYTILHSECPLHYRPVEQMMDLMFFSLY